MFHSACCLFHAKSYCLSDREKSCGFWCKLRSTLVFGIKQIVCMYVCKSLFQYGKSSVKLKLKTKTNKLQLLYIPSWYDKLLGKLFHNMARCKKSFVSNNWRLVWTGSAFPQSFLSCKQSDAERKDFVDIPEQGNSWFYTSSGFLFLSSVP